jgi:hypothetical protein
MTAGPVSVVPPRARGACRNNVLKDYSYATGQAGEAASPAFASPTGTIASRATPFFTAVISARIEIAISGGVRLPM